MERKRRQKSDGYPEDWYVPGKLEPTTTRIIRTQPCCGITIMPSGVTRLNVYAGMFGCFIVRDDFEDGLNLPKGEV